jgi:hypothetical protein
MDNEKPQNSETSAKAEREKSPRALNTELGRTYGGAANAPVPAHAIVDELGERAAAQGELLLEWMKARPITSGAIGLGIGLLIGLAIGRRVH